MKKISLIYGILICLIISNSVQGQSKKKQIDLLNSKLDSLTGLNTVLQDSLYFEALVMEEAINRIQSTELRLVQLQKEFDEISKENSDLRSIISTLEDEIHGITAAQGGSVEYNEDDNDLDDFIITTNSVGPYVIGNSFPEADGIESIRKEETRWGEEASQYEVVYYDILLGKEKLMEVHVNSYSKITGISILSPRIRTSNGIRVGSTIEEFTAAFSDYRILYNYVTDWYWIESRSEGGGIKYRLDEKNLLNPRIDAVITEFKKSDWSRDSEIKIIECGSRQLN